MSCSAIYCANTSTANIPADGIVSPGSVVRRFGCNLNLSGNGVEIRGDGYYQIIASITLDPSEAGGVTATLLQDGVAILGAAATTEAATGITLVIPTILRLRCCCDAASAITCQLSAAAEVTNFTIQVVKL